MCWIRISAPTKGFQEYCGKKTTHRITNSRNFAYREYQSEIDMQHMRSPNNIEVGSCILACIMILSATLSDEMPLAQALIDQKRRHPKKRLYGIHTDFINYMDDSLE